MERSAPKDKSVSKDLRVQRDLKALAERQDHQDPTERKANLEYPASLGTRDHLGTKATKVLLACWDDLETKASGVTQGCQASAASKDPGDSVELEDEEERQAFLDPRVTLASRDHRDLMVIKEPKVLRDLQVLREL